MQYIECKVKPVDVANYIANTAIKMNEPINHTRIQNILYVLYKAALKRGYELFETDYINAFFAAPMGPRSQDVRMYYAAWGEIPINRLVEKTPPMPDNLVHLFNYIVMDNVKKSPAEFLKDWKREGTAWQQAYRKNENNLILKSHIEHEITIYPDKY